MPTYVVLSGGGAHGAFAVGALTALRDAGVHFNGIIGIAAGALMAPFVAIDELAVVHDLYTSVRTRDMVRWWPWNRVTRHAWFSTVPLWQFIQRHLTEERYQRLLHSPVEVWLTTVNVSTGAIIAWNPSISGPNGRPLSRDTFMAAMLAAATPPVFALPVRLPDGTQHVEAGLRELAPLKRAIAQGADTIYAIVPAPAHPQPITSRSATKLQVRMWDLLRMEILSHDVGQAELYNKVLTYIERVREKAAQHVSTEMVQELFDPESSPFAGKRRLTLHVIRPDQALPGDSLTFEPRLMQEMLTLGEQAARQHLAASGGNTA